MSKREIATKKATMNAADSFQMLLVNKNAHGTVKAENKATTTECAMYSGSEVNKIMDDVKIWYPGKVRDVPPPIW